MTGYLETAGEVVAVHSELPWVSELIEQGAAGELHPAAPRPPTVLVEVERDRQPFACRGWEPLTRGARCFRGEVVVEDLMATGFDLLARLEDGVPCLRYRYRPPMPSRAAATVLRQRFVLLARAALIQYPAIWRAGGRNRAPLHALACTAGGAVALLSGPAGVGKSTLVEMEVAAGGRATSDNVSVADGVSVWGLVEPSRTESGEGARTTHGRREGRLPGRSPRLDPTALIVVRRGTGLGPALLAAGTRRAAESLIASTYMAGELRRYWGFAALLAEGTGWGPPHPPVEAVSRILATRLPAFEVHLADRPRPRLAELIQNVEATT